MAHQNQGLRADETIDDLILGNFRIIQPVHGYRFSLDAVLLAHFCQLDRVGRVIDLGTGNGVIALLLAARRPKLRIIGIEIQEAMVDRARRSVRLNHLEEDIEIIKADIRDLVKTHPGGSAELILSNPPFWKKGQGRVNANLEEAVARHELQLTLDELVQAGAHLLVPGGKMALIQRVARLEEVVETYARYRLYPYRMRLVHSFIDRSASLVLLEGRKNRPGKLEILAPLVIYAQPNQYSEEIKKLYQEK